MKVEDFENALVVDIEARSRVNISGNNSPSTQQYAEHESTEIICLCAHDVKSKMNYKIEVLGKTQAELKKALAPLAKFSGWLVAHSALFEFLVLNESRLEPLLKGWYDPDRWLCTMNMAYAAGMTWAGALDKVAALLKVGQKLADGKDLIRNYCQPIRGNFRPITKAVMKRFLNYCFNDVAVQTTAYKKLLKILADSFELDVALLYQRINLEGLPIDLASARKVNATIEEKITIERERALKKFGTAKGDGLLVESPQALKEFVNQRVQKNLQIDSAQADILDALAQRLQGSKKASHKLVLEALNARRILSSQVLRKIQRFSVFDLKKNPTGLCNKEGKSKIFVQFCGAATKRGSGKNLQIHNMFRGSVENFDKSLRSLSNLDGQEFVEETKKLCRQLIKAPGRDYFYIADFSAIEARIGFWLIGSKKWLEVFRAYDAGEGFEPYVVKFAELTRKSPEKVSEPERDTGKILVLSANYGLGGTALHRRLIEAGLEYKNTVSIQYAPAAGGLKKKIVDLTYHESLAGMWLEKVKFDTATGKGLLVFRHGINVLPEVFEFNLPKKCKIVNVKQNFEAGNFINEYRNSLPELKEAWQLCGKAFKEAYNRTSGTVKLKLPLTEIVFKCSKEYFEMVLPSGRSRIFWRELTKIEHYYATKVFQNIVQTIARDVMIEAALAIDSSKEFTFCFDVHDELVARAPKKAGLLKKYLAILERPLPWAPDLIIKAEGEVSKRYKKI